MYARSLLLVFDKFYCISNNATEFLLLDFFFFFFSGKGELLVTEVVTCTVVMNSQVQEISRCFLWLSFISSEYVTIYMLAFVFQFQLYIMPMMEE